MNVITVVYENLDNRNCENCSFFLATNTTEECFMEIMSNDLEWNTATISCSEYAPSDAVQIGNPIQNIRIKR